MSHGFVGFHTQRSTQPTWLRGYMWIESSGGPLMLMAEKNSNAWRGIHGSSYPNFNSDYERACVVDDYVNVLGFNREEVVVFGDEPDRTSCIQISNSEFVIVRWRWAPNEKVVKDYLKDIKNIQYTDTDVINFNLEHEDIVIFDSSLPVNENQHKLTCKLSVGKYIIQTAEFRPKNDTYLLLHRFYKAT